MVRRTRLPKRRYAVVDERIDRVVGLSKIENPDSCWGLMSRVEAKRLVSTLKTYGKNVRVVKVEP